MQVIFKLGKLKLELKLSDCAGLVNVLGSLICNDVKCNDVKFVNGSLNVMMLNL